MSSPFSYLMVDEKKTTENKTELNLLSMKDKQKRKIFDLKKNKVN